MARPHIRLELPAHDREILRSWLRASKTKRSLAERAELILLCGQGFTATQVSEKLSQALAHCSGVAQTLPAAGTVRTGGSTSLRPPPKVVAGQSAGHPHRHGATDSLRVDLLECTPDGRARRSKLPSGHSDLEGGRSETASHPQLQDQPQPSFRREGDRCRRALHGPSRQCSGLICGREDPDPSPG